MLDSNSPVPKDSTPSALPEQTELPASAANVAHASSSRAPVLEAHRRYHISREGKVIADFPGSDLRGMYESGLLRPSDFAWAAGLSAWVPLPALIGAEPTTATEAPPLIPPRHPAQPRKPDTNRLFRLAGQILVGISFALGTFYWMIFDISVRGDLDSFQRVANSGLIADRQAGLTYSLQLGLFGVSALIYDRLRK